MKKSTSLLLLLLSFFLHPVYSQGHANQCMDRGSFRYVLAEIESAGFSEDMEDLAKDYIRNGNICACQIAEIVEVLTFSDSKLEVAKNGWKYVPDPENYRRVKESLRSRCDQDELSKYMRNHPQASSCHICGRFRCRHLQDLRAFDEFVDRLEEEDFDDDRVEMAIRYIRNYPLSSNQIAEINQTFAFDKHALEFSKEAWHYCYDPENYYRVCDGLTFSSSARKLRAYIDQQ